MNQDPLLPESDASSQAAQEAEVNAVVSLIGRLPADNVVRRLTLRLIRREPLETIAPLLAVLQTPSAPGWREREAAAWTLGRAPLRPEDADAALITLLAALEKERRESLWTRLGRGIWRSFLVALPFSLLLSLEVSLREPPYNPPWLILFAQMQAVYSAIGFLGMGPASIVYDSYLNNRVRAAAAVSLGHLRAFESVGALAGALFDRSPRVASAAAAALHELLPTLTAEHYGQVGAQSVMNLGRALSDSDSQLVLKILEALNKVGTSHAIPYVERVEKRGRTVRLRDAAASVLVTLRARQHQENLRATLLRPAESPDNPADVLLRPARSSEDYDLQYLLRPAEDEGMKG